MGMLYKVGGTWYYGVKVDGKWIRRSSRSASKQVAQDLQDRDRLKVAAGIPLESEATPEETFSQFAERYLKCRQANGEDMDREEDALANCKAAFGEKPLAAVSRQDVDDYLTARRKKIKPGTIQRELNSLKAMLNQAVRWGLIAKNPAALMTVRGANVPRERLLSRDDITALFEASPPLLRDLIETALLTGMDLGEVLDLEERRCDFFREEIRLPSYKTRPPRTIPMHPRVKDILWARCQGREDRQLFPIVNVHRPFQKAVKAAKLTNLRFKDLRHCAASYLLMAGADPRTVMQVLGHKDPRMTLRVYAMVSTEHVKAAIGKLSFGGGSDMTRTSREKNASTVSIQSSENA